MKKKEYYIVNNITHEEWLEKRKLGIGASEIGSLMGVDAYRSPYELWRLKMGLDVPEPEDESLWVGHHIEPMAAERFALLTGATIKRGTQGDWLAVNSERPYMRVSPDRLYWAEGEPHSPRTQRILEIKSTKFEVDPENLPKKWVLQLQYQMGVMGVAKGAIGWWTSAGFEKGMIHFNFKEMDFDPFLYMKITEACEEFWNNYILPRKEPPFSTVRDVNTAYPQATGTCITASKETLENLNSFKKNKEEAKQAKQVMTDAEERASINEMRLKAELGTADTMVDSNGKKILSWTNSKGRTTFDAELFKKEHPEMVDRYFKEGKPFRTFRIHNN